MIYIAASQYNANDSALEIYVSGCTNKCEGCHNQELQEFGVGKKWPIWFRLNKNKLTVSPLIKRVFVMGGDALCQDSPSFLDMMGTLQRTGLELWLFTGKRLDEIKSEFKVFQFFDFIKTGRYVKDSPSEVIYELPEGMKLTLASDNQQLFKVLDNKEAVECRKKLVQRRSAR